MVEMVICKIQYFQIHLIVNGNGMSLLHLVEVEEGMEMVDLIKMKLD